MEGGGGGGGATTFCTPPPPAIIHPHFPSMSIMLNSKHDHTCINLIYVAFILFEGISKSIFFNSILNFAILSGFSVRNVNI